ncbi:pyruvate kinase [Spirochaetota bacterium]
MHTGNVKILATIGPSSSSLHIIKGLMKNGANAARLNFSHGTHDEHKRRFKLIRQASRTLAIPFAVIADLQGPKIRIGELEGYQPVELERGKNIIITAEDIAGTSDIISTTYPGLIRDISPGNMLMIDDGLIRIRVLKKDRKSALCKVIEGGVLGERKGINLPGVKISTPSFTKKDRKDLALALELGVDYIALSFVRTEEDVIRLKKMIQNKNKSVRVIAKIEKPEAVKRIDRIIEEADGIMIARGDLGVEMSPSQVPMIQKEIIRKANKKNKLVIVATQMLESMRKSRIPTRAEASDVANAVIDSADALMLSGETAMGKYPVESVKMMRKIIGETERSSFIPEKEFAPEDWDDTVENAAIHAASFAAKELGTSLIGAFTLSGRTALHLSKKRPSYKVIAFTPAIEAYNAMSLLWNITPVNTGYYDNIEKMFAAAKEYVVRKKLVKKRVPVVFVTGEMGIQHSANTIKII